MFDAWVEGDDFAYIKMELGSSNLSQAFDRRPEGRLESLEFFLSCHVFEEVARGIHYLHSRVPAIMHRDLKPDNVLICEPCEGVFLKTDSRLTSTWPHSTKGRVTQRTRALFVSWLQRYAAPGSTTSRPTFTVWVSSDARYSSIKQI